MTKKIILLALCSMLFALCLSAAAQQPKKVPRIGYLTASLPFHYHGPHRGLPGRPARAGIHGRAEHRH